MVQGDWLGAAVRRAKASVSPSSRTKDISYEVSFLIVAILYEEIFMECIMIGIAGGTGSGKSTFTNRLKERFSDDVTVIYHDNYYRRRDDMTYEERTKVNYDHPDSLETELLIEHLRMLKAGVPVECPIY